MSAQPLYRLRTEILPDIDENLHPIKGSGTLQPVCEIHIPDTLPIGAGLMIFYKTIRDDGAIVKRHAHLRAAANNGRNDHAMILDGDLVVPVVPEEAFAEPTE